MRDIIASPQAVANRLIQEIFLLFNAEDISAKTIAGWQNKLVTKKR